jgi:hypothetical protein
MATSSFAATSSLLLASSVATADSVALGRNPLVGASAASTAEAGETVAAPSALVIACDDTVAREQPAIRSDAKSAGTIDEIRNRARFCTVHLDEDDLDTERLLN